MKYDKGHSTLTVFIIILFLSSISLSSLYFVQISIGKSRKFQSVYETREYLDEKVESLLKVLGDDPTPESDSSFDPVWEYIENENHDDIHLTLEDLSSKININFVRTKMLEESSFRSMMIYGKSPEDLKQFRGENGFSTDIQASYGDFFEEEDLNEYFTTYSYANFNVTYEDSLKILYEIRVPDGSSQSFLSMVQSHISSKKIAGIMEYKDLVGSDFDLLFPLINTESLINVNFAPELVLESILKYPYGGETHEQSNAFYEVLVAERSTFEISDEKLNSLLDVEEDYLRMKEYLGVRTWFWKITAVEKDHSLTVILARIPVNEIGKHEKKFKMIQWRYHNG